MTNQPSRRAVPSSGRMLSWAMLAAVGIGIYTAMTAVSAAPVWPAPTQILIGRCYDVEPTTERPTQLLFGCDGTGVLQNMAWSAWGPAGADGVGTVDETNCVPSCADGTRQTYRVVVHAANPISPGPPCPSGFEFYRDLIIAYPNGMPSGFDPTDPNFTKYDGMPAYHYDATPTCASQ